MFGMNERGWIALGVFVLAFVELGAMAINPAVAQIELFKTITQATWAGGLLVAISYYFGSAKS